MTEMSALSIWIVAFTGDSARLTATLEKIPTALHRTVTVLASDDPALAACLAEIRAGNEHGESNPHKPVPALKIALPASCDDACFWSTVIPRLDDSGPCFVIRAGTLLPDHWAGRLFPALTPEVAAVFPLSVRHPCTMVFNDTGHESGLDVQDVDHWLNKCASGRVFDIPVLAGHSALLVPSRCQQLLARDVVEGSVIDSDAVLARALIETGSTLLASDALYVDDSVLPPQTLPQDLHEGWRDACERHALTAMRHALTELSRRRERPPIDLPSVKPVCLHISHGWGGGLWRWVDDAMEADAGREQGARHLVLRPVGDWSAFCQTLILSDSLHGATLASWTLSRPILSTAVSHHEYQQILSQVIADYGVSRLMVSSVIGHALQVLKTGLPTVIVCHDFYPVCPPILANWNTPCVTCNDERMQRCLVQNPDHRFFKHEAFSHWQALRLAYLDRVMQHKIPMVAPTPSVVKRLVSLAPSLRDHDFSVIPHGLPRPLIDALAPMRQLQHSPGERIRIVVLGGAGDHKGGKLLLDSIAELTEFADLILLGFGDACEAFAGKTGVTCVSRYQRGRLGELLVNHAPDVGLLLSTVPETFSYTLSELQAAAIPVAATALGAFADRIIPDENGWLFEPESAALLSLLKALHRHPERLVAVRDKLRDQQPRDAVDMMMAYESLLTARVTVFPVHRPGKKVSKEKDAIYISTDVTYREAWSSFMSYTITKLSRTQKLPSVIRRLLLKVLKG